MHRAGQQAAATAGGAHRTTLPITTRSVANSPVGAHHRVGRYESCPGFAAARWSFDQLL
jgi:hypothetical protein